MKQFTEKIKKHIGDYLYEIFSDGSVLSSKRIFGAIGFIAFIVLCFAKIDNSTVQSLGFISAALLGLGTLVDIANSFKK
jgi:hypothetical protein